MFMHQIHLNCASGICSAVGDSDYAGDKVLAKLN